MLMVKKDVRSSSNKAVSRARFPLGELARRRELKETYLSKNAELKDLQKDVQKDIKKGMYDKDYGIKMHDTV